MKQKITYGQTELWEALSKDIGLPLDKIDAMEFIITKVRPPQPEVGEQHYLRLVTGVNITLKDGVELPK